MELVQGIKAIDLGLWISSSKTLVLCDFHLGYEGEMQNKGVLVPRFLYKDVIDRLEGMFARISDKIETIVINGDLKHEFGRISSQEWQEVMRLLDYLDRKCNKIILIKGNHDTILGPIADKQNIKVVNEHIVDNILIIHGHKLPSSLKNIIIVGHEHPAICLQEDVRREKYKCYLVGKYKRKTLIVQPSFNLLTEGTDVISGKLLIPFLTDVSDFDVFVVDEKQNEVLEFGKVSGLE
jgi:hypothetical protein